MRKVTVQHKFMKLSVDLGQGSVHCSVLPVFANIYLIAGTGDDTLWSNVHSISKDKASGELNFGSSEPSRPNLLIAKLYFSSQHPWETWEVKVQ